MVRGWTSCINDEDYGAEYDAVGGVAEGYGG